MADWIPLLSIPNLQAIVVNHNSQQADWLVAGDNIVTDGVLTQEPQPFPWRATPPTFVFQDTIYGIEQIYVGDVFAGNTLVQTRVSGTVYTEFDILSMPALVFRGPFGEEAYPEHVELIGENLYYFENGKEYYQPSETVTSDGYLYTYYDSGFFFPAGTEFSAEILLEISEAVQPPRTVYANFYDFILSEADQCEWTDMLGVSVSSIRLDGSNYSYVDQEGTCISSRIVFPTKDAFVETVYIDPSDAAIYDNWGYLYVEITSEIFNNYPLVVISMESVVTTDRGTFPVTIQGYVLNSMG